MKTIIKELIITISNLRLTEISKKNIVILKLLCIPILCFSFSTYAQKWESQISIAMLIPSGSELANSYKVGIALEPEFNFVISNKFKAGAAIVLHGFINKHDDNLTDYFIQYGPLFNLSYNALAIRNFEFHPLLGMGYAWGQNFFVSKGTANNNGETTQLLYSNGFYWRVGISVPASDRIKIGLIYNFHRPTVSISEEAKKLFTQSNIGSPLYGSIMAFPRQRMSFDNIMIAVALKL